MDSRIPGEVGDELGRVLRDRHGVAGRDDLDARFREVGRRLDRGRVRCRDDHCELVAGNVDGSAAARPLSTSFFGLVVSAERKTSAGAPCSIWVSRAAEESVEIVSLEPGRPFPRRLHLVEGALEDAAA